MTTDVRSYQLFIDGVWKESTTSNSINVTNPATGKVVAVVPDGSSSDVQLAVEAARKAFESWRFVSQRERADILRKIALRIREQFEELLTVEVSEVGRPVAEMRAVDIAETADCFDYYASAARLNRGNTIPVMGPYLDYTLIEPLGVIGQITPWNFPLNIASWKIAPALAVGNCIVMKPSELAPSSTLELAQIALEAGLPNGVLNVVTGRGTTAGKALVENPDVDMISFTGSAKTGFQIAELAARHGKKTVLELGGKSAQILFHDCDIEAAVASVVEGVFFAQGENCCAGSRLLVAKKISSDVIGRIEALAKKLKIGMPEDPQTQIGCLISENHFERVKAYIDAARRDQTKVVTCGDIPSAPEFKGRPFLAPTLIIDPGQDSGVIKEEIFGPVLAINTFENEEEAVRLANYGNHDLAAGVWTNDVSRAHRVARKLRAGTVWVNTFNRLFNDAPFGGHRWSGFGRDLGLEALAQYSNVKNVCVCHEPGSDKWFNV